MSGRVTGRGAQTGAVRNEADTHAFADMLRRGTAGTYRDDACGHVQHHDERQQQGGQQHDQGDVRHQVEANAHSRDDVIRSFTGVAAAVSGIQSQVQKILPRLESLNRQVDSKTGADSVERQATDGIAFSGAEGGTFDIKGEPGKVYNILSDRGIQLNAMFDVRKGRDDQTIVRDVGVSLGADRIEVRGDGDVLLNGEAMEDGTHLNGALEITGGRVHLRNAEYDIELKQYGGYVNDIYFTAKNARADGVMPHGLWGNTLDGDGLARHGDMGYGAQGGGALMGADGYMSQRGDTDAVTLYKVADLFDTIFETFNQFDAIGTPRPQGGGFEGWLNGMTFEWSNYSLDIDVTSNAQPGSEQVNQSLMHYGVERLRNAIASLEPLVETLAGLGEAQLSAEQYGPVNALKELLKLLSQMVELIAVAAHNGGSPDGSRPLQEAGREVASALDGLHALKPLLSRLETFAKAQPGAADFGESRAHVSVEIDTTINADLRRSAAVRQFEMNNSGVMSAGELQSMMLSTRGPSRNGGDW